MRGGGGRQPYVAPDGADAASIPASSRKMVRSLKGILADRSEGEIYAMLCDCSMDPRHRRREAHLPRHGGFLGCDAESSGNSIRLLPSRDYEGQMTLFDDDAEETEEPEVKIAEAAVKFLCSIEGAGGGEGRHLGWWIW